MATNKNSTSNDLPTGSRQVTKAEADAFDLDPHLINLMWDEPFFSNVLRTVTKVRDEKIPTAGVLAKDGDINLWWNPYFLASLTSKQIKGLLKHECFHLVFQHTTVRRMTPHILHNYACDLAINSMIPGDELPEGGLVPGKAFKPLTAEEAQKIGPEAVARYKRISDKIASLPLNLSAEQYFALLQEVSDDIQKGGKGKSLAQAIKDGDVNVDDEGNVTDADGNPVSIIPGSGEGGSMDDHEGWDSMDDAERELIKGKINQALEKAAKQCDSSGQWGSVSSETRAMIRELLNREVDWKSILKQFCGTSRRADRANNVKKLNRKYPGIMPGVHRSYTSSIAVYIDQSGSVSDEDLELLFGSLMALAKHTEFTLYNFDTTVDLKSERTWKGNNHKGLARTRCGGTDFKAASDHANKNKHRFDGYIICSDGECDDPGPSMLKRGWVIVPDRTMGFTPGNRDVVVKMKRSKKVA